MRRTSVCTISALLSLACGGGSRSAAPAPAEQTPAEVPAKQDAVEVAVEQPAIPTATDAKAEDRAPEPIPAVVGESRLEAVSCDACGKAVAYFAAQCVVRIHADAREELGCGKVAHTGRYGATVVEHDDPPRDGDWLAMRYIDAEGKTLGAPWECDSLSADCLGPGRFLAVGDGRWVHEQGYAGDGTNDNVIRDLSTGARHELPEGEYELLVDPQRSAVGLVAIVPNIDLPDGSSGWRVQLGCFDLEGARLTQGPELLVPGDAIDPVLDAEPAFGGDDLVFAIAGREPLRLRCGPRS